MEDAFLNTHSRPEFDQFYNFCRKGRNVLNIEATNDCKNKDTVIQKPRMEIHVTERIVDMAVDVCRFSCPRSGC